LFQATTKEECVEVSAAGRHRPIQAGGGVVQNQVESVGVGNLLDQMAHSLRDQQPAVDPARAGASDHPAKLDVLARSCSNGSASQCPGSVKPGWKGRSSVQSPSLCASWGWRRSASISSTRCPVHSGFWPAAQNQPTLASEGTERHGHRFSCSDRVFNEAQAWCRG